MKYTALILLSAIALAKTENSGVYLNGCPKDWSVEKLLPHPDCHKFYQCWDGKLVEHSCAENLYFSVEANQCEWSEVVDCTATIVPEKESDEANNSNIGAGNCDPSKAPEICAADGSDSVLVAHEKCNKYYICNHGKPVTRRCQAGLFFNPKTDRCDWPEKVECGDRIIPGGESGDHGNGNGSSSNENNDNDSVGDDNSGSDTDNQNVGAGNCDPNKAPEICAADGSDSVLVAHEKCNKYYICDHGKPIPRRCQVGLFFNPKTDKCDWPENVDCGDRVIPDSESGGNDNSDGSSSNESNDNGGNDNNGNDNGGSDNGNENVGAGNCDPSKAPEICAADGSDSVLVAHEKCNKYYICDHGKPVARRCQVGLFFNPKTDRCDWPENVDCGDRIIPDGESGGNDNSDSISSNESNDNNGNDNGGSDNGNENVGAGNCDPSKAPEICAADDSDSVLVAHEKCNKYYICAHGIPIARPCQAGLFFNPKTDRCDWPENVECGDRVIPDSESGGNDNGDGSSSNESNDNGGNDNGGSGNGNENVGGGNCDPNKAPEICAADDSDSVLVAHEKCNKYYICAHGIPVARLCQAGLFFNPKTDRCDWPENVECGDRVIPDGESGGNDNGDGSSSNESNDNGGNDNNGNDNDGSDNGNENVGAGNCDPSKAPEICAADDSDSVLVAHEKCNKYYICAHGIPVARPCQAGLFFNPKTDRCDWPENVECGDRVIPDGESGGNDNGDGSSSNESNDNGGNDNNGNDNDGSDNGNENVGAGNCDPSKAPEICAADDSDSVLVAHEKCNKYYICAHGIPVARPCQAGLFFNPKTDRCDWPENVECGDRVIPDGESGGNDNSDGSSSNENNDNGGNDNNGNDNGGSDNGNENVGAGNCDPSKAPEICATDDSDSVLVAHEKCNKYYICAHGIPIARPCQAGLFFNPKTDRCDWPENVECGDRVIPDSENGGNDNGDGSSSNESNDNGGNDNNGNDNGGSDNGNENVGAGNCDPSKAPEICAADGSDSVLVAHEKCNKYYICVHGQPIPRPCQAGLFFNPKTDKCDWPENVECGDRVIPDGESGGNDNGDGSSSNESNDNGGNDNGGSGNGNENVGGGNCDPNKAPEICAADDSDSVLVAHEKCNKYYICAHGIPVARLCQAGLFFNPKTDRCDWPENVECGDRVIPDGESGGNDNGDGSSSNESNDNGGNDNNGNDNDGSDNGNENVGAGNCDPSKAPEICAADDSDSVLVAHEKCNKYYICAHGIPIARPCQAGLFFNPKTDRCDWPENVECGDRVIPDSESGGNDNGDGSSSNESNDNGGNDNGGSGNGNENVGGGNCDPNKAPEICAADDSDSVLVAHEKCNKYYICAHGIPVARLCQAGLFFNPKTDRCDWPENVECGDRVIPDGESGGNDNGDGSSSNESNDNGGNDNNGNDNDGSDNGNENVGAGNCDPSKAPEICAADDSDSVLVAHEKCNKYYICAHGIPVARPCQAGLFFNPKTDRCDWPENVECGDRVIPDGESGGNDNGDGSSSNESNDNGGNDNNGNDNDGSDNGNENVGAGNCDPSKAPEICAADDSDSVLVAHEKCNKYYICAHGIPVARPCQAGLFFNPKTDRCDWPENVECGDRVIPDGESGGNDNSDGSSSNENNDNGGNDNNGNDNGGSDNGNENVGAGNCDPSKAPEICATDDSDSVLVAHEKCNKYYICAHGIPIARPCQAGLFFNPKTDRCDWPENVECGDRVIPDSENGGNDNGDGSSSNESNDNGGNDNNGNDNGGSDNGNENVGAGNCDPSKAPEICAADGSDSVLVAHEKCNKYYICVHGQPIPRPCQAGLFFNPKTDKCDWPENVECGDRVIPDGESGGNDNGDGSSSNENNDNGGNDNGGSDNGNENVGAGNCDPSKAPEICAADGSDSVLVAHEKCNKYYICVNGHPIPRPCQSGLFFNHKTDRCDWPENVECGDRVIPDGESDGNDNGGGNSNESNDNGGSENGGSDNGGSDNGGNDNDNQNVGECNCDPSKAPEICAAEGSDDVLVAHEKCNKFYVCAHGKPISLRCQVGLLFNPKIERCDWSENVECGDRVIPGGENDDNNGNDNGGNDNGGSDNGGNENGDNDNGGNDNDNQNIGECNCDPSKAPEICAAEGSDNVLVAHEKCNKYYVCAHGKPISLRCQVGLLFNPKIERCDWPENVECGDRVIPGGENEDNNGNDNGGNDNGGSDNGGNDNDNQNVGECNCDPSKAPEICAAEGSDDVLVAHEKCNKYYVCAHGKPISLRCQVGLLFNPKIERCDWPENVECGDRVIPGGEDEDNNGNDNGGNDNGGNDNGGNENGDNDNEGDDNDNQNVGECNCDPSKAPEICAAEGSDDVLVAHEKCNKYYVCAHGKPISQRCQVGLLFNPKIERCDWPENVNCGDRVITGDENEDNNGNDNNGNDNDGNDNGGNDNGGNDNSGNDNNGNENGDSENDNQNVGECNCDPSKAPEICAAEGSDDVLVAHEKCNKFYVCANGKPVSLRCPANLLYNPHIKECDWPENVDCSDKVSPDSQDNDNNNSGNGNIGAGNNDPSLAPIICADEKSNGVFVAHELCTKFYTCSNGKPVTLRCPANLFFNPSIDECDWPQYVNCGNRIVPSGFEASLNKHLEGRRTLMRWL